MITVSTAVGPAGVVIDSDIASDSYGQAEEQRRIVAEEKPKLTPMLANRCRALVGSPSITTQHKGSGEYPQPQPCGYSR